MQSRSYWFHIIGLSVTVAILLALAIAALTATAALGFGQKDPNSPDSEKVQAFTGVLTDSHCGARHLSSSRLNAGDCVRICLKQGSTWALVNGDKVYRLTGDSPDFDKLAGERVKILGMMDGHTLQVQTIEPAVP